MFFPFLSHSAPSCFSNAFIRACNIYVYFEIQKLIRTFWGERVSRAAACSQNTAVASKKK